MRYYYVDRDFWHIGFTYDAALVQDVRRFANSSYNPENKEWCVPVHITTSAMIQNWLKTHNFEQRRVYVPSRRFLSYVEVPETVTVQEVLQAADELGLKRRLRPYQASGVAYMINHGNCINGDCCGLGKSGQSIVTAELIGAFPLLVICPSSVKYNWQKEWGKWNPDRTVGVVSSKMDDSTWQKDVVVINFDMLMARNTQKLTVKYKELLKRYWGGCIIDEIHFLKSEKAVRTRLTKKITKSIPNIWGLTGTLTQNRPAELIQPYQILRKFNETFGDTLEFKYRYCDGKRTLFGFDSSGASNLEELHELLKKSGYIRREKREVLAELPPVVIEKVDVPIDNEKEYCRAENDLLHYLEGIDVARANSAVNAPHLVMLNTLKQLSIKGKLKFIQAYISDWMEANVDRQLVVFGVHREPLQTLADYFQAPVIQGGISIEEKQHTVDDFAALKHRLLFANIQSAGTGTDGLQTHCSDMIFMELPDRSTDIDQTIARLERMGQQNSVTVTYLLSPQTIDVEMMETLDDKRILTDAINAGRNSNEVFTDKFFTNRHGRKYS